MSDVFGFSQRWSAACCSASAPVARLPRRRHPHRRPRHRPRRSHTAPCPHLPHRAQAIANQLRSLLRADVQQLADPLGRFGLALLAREAAAHPTGNIVLSPLSISDALTMALNGARGTTASQMQQALGLDGIDLGAEPTRPGPTSSPTWIRRQTRRSGWPTRSGSSRAILSCRRSWPTDRDYFAAGATPLPADLEQAVKTINAWVDERTGGRIPALLQ